MNENKPTSLAITIVTLLSMFHVTMVIGGFTVVLMLIGWRDSMDVFYYWTDYTLPITFLISILNGVRIEDNIFEKKKASWENDDYEGLIVQIPTYSLVISFVIILIINVFKWISWDLGIFIFHVFIFGGIATYVATRYIILPFTTLLNLVIGLLTNRIFNTIFTKHLRIKGITQQAQTQSHKKTRRGNNGRK